MRRLPEVCEDEEWPAGLWNGEEIKEDDYAMRALRVLFVETMLLLNSNSQLVMVKKSTKVFHFN